MKRKLFVLTTGLIAAIVGIVLTSSQQAKPYGMAGCGLGAMLIGPKPGKIQIVSAIVNNLIVPQTSAITSGSSNCYNEGVIKAEAEQRVYVSMNMETLKKDIALGQGERLNSLAFLMGCSTDSMQAFGVTTKANFDKIFNNEDMEADFVLNRIKTAVVSEKRLAESCKKIWL